MCLLPIIEFAISNVFRFLLDLRNFTLLVLRLSSRFIIKVNRIFKCPRALDIN